MFVSGYSARGSPLADSLHVSATQPQATGAELEISFVKREIKIVRYYLDSGALIWKEEMHSRPQLGVLSISKQRDREDGACYCIPRTFQKSASIICSRI
jgi:hypothetical protein